MQNCEIYLGKKKIKLYQYDAAPSSKRVEKFLKETNIQVEIIQLNIMEGEHLREPFKTMNPFNCIPFLELDDGTVISESLAICKYLEQTSNSEIKLFGENAKEKALIEMWYRRLENDGYLPLFHGARNKFEMFKGAVIPGTRTNFQQNLAVTNWAIESAKTLLTRLDNHLQSLDFLVSNKLTVADITGFHTLRYAERVGIDIKSYESAFVWFCKLEQRPAFQEIAKLS